METESLTRRVSQSRTRNSTCEFYEIEPFEICTLECSIVEIEPVNIDPRSHRMLPKKARAAPKGSP